MKRILGLDLGVASVGWALVEEAENKNEKSSIVKVGVRVVPLSTDEQSNFAAGKSITTNADRTLKRSARRNLQRYKLRRTALIEVLEKAGIITTSSILSEDGKNTTFETCKLRAQAATERIELEQFARVLLQINKKRGYKSSRKVNNKDEGELVDGMDIAKLLIDENLTPGQYGHKLLLDGKKFTPPFYASDLQNELDRIWDYQKQFYPKILTDTFRDETTKKTQKAVSYFFSSKYGIYTAENKGAERKKASYKWRVDGLVEQLEIEKLAYVIADLSGLIANSSGYLGAISDRSKELYFNKLTVGQWQMQQLAKDSHSRLKDQVFYRSNYMDEFETIWATQARFHDVLTEKLREEIRDIVIFYQRKLKSQKGLISYCEFESRQVKIGHAESPVFKTNGFRVCPKSSPIFQEFRIWHMLNNIELSEKSGVGGEKYALDLEQKQLLFQELDIKPKLTQAQVLKILGLNSRNFQLNHAGGIEGNRTKSTLFRAFLKIVELTGHGEYSLEKSSTEEIKEIVESVFKALGFDTSILNFDAGLENPAFENQPMYRLWHLIYSFEDDDSNTGNEKLIEKLRELYGFDKQSATILANLNFEPDYGSLSTKAMRKILPHLKDGNEYSVACTCAGYNHSKRSLTKEQKEQKEYKNQLNILSKNSLRNPVVEKILNQMINVVNEIVKSYGKPDEIRIELARELKKNAKQRDEMSKSIKAATTAHEAYREELRTKFGLTSVSRNDIVRYKLYLELESNGYNTLYSNTYISPGMLFSKEFDIEHIIPQARLFDDSFSNKTLELASINREKSNDTACDYVEKRFGEEGLVEYLQRINKLFESGSITKTKYDKLRMKKENIPEGFLNRDLGDTQYISRKAKEILEDMVPEVISTTGSITDRLRNDWQLIDTMKELNWDKYSKIENKTVVTENRDGHKIRKIVDWSKRDDHRHHAMDAITIAFTKRQYIQYLNTLNAKDDVISEEREYERKTYLQGGRFVAPMPLDELRREAKKHLENVLVSLKAKNKVVTPNTNKTNKKGGGTNSKVQLTPRGPLHNETIYGKTNSYSIKEIRVNASLTAEVIASVINKSHRKALEARLDAFGGDPKNAFTGKNSPSKNPVYTDISKTNAVPEKIEIREKTAIYTKRVAISPDLKEEKIIDPVIRAILEQRLNDFDGDRKKAFSNLEENPIWLNEKTGLKIKRVTITAINEAVSLHDKKDKDGNLILCEQEKKQAVDFVNTSNNHHAAIYRDAKGAIQERIVPFFDAVTLALAKMPVVDKNYNEAEGWEFLFTMKKNEYFVFPNSKTGFDPQSIVLTDRYNYSAISPNLFRVQKFSTKIYYFRHHLETKLEDNEKLRDMTWKRMGPSGLEGAVKVRVNHIGEIVSVGEY